MRCPFCKKTELILLDKETGKYFCQVCAKDYYLVKLIGKINKEYLLPEDKFDGLKEILDRNKNDKMS